MSLLRSNHRSRGAAWLLACCAALLFTPLPPAAAQDASRSLLQQVEASLKRKDAGAVHDLGRLLKPGGVRELNQLAERFKSEKINVYFVTTPRGSVGVDQLAETVYRDLNGQPTDMLILFDGQRVYGKTLALKGNKQAFADAFREAQPGFKQYYARGMAMFAEALRKRIQGRRADASPEPAPGAPPAPDDPPAPDAVPGEGSRRGLGLVALPLFFAGVAVVGGGLVIRHNRSRVLSGQGVRLRSAEAVYNRITLEMPDPAPDELNREWLRLDEKFRRVKSGKGSLAELVDLEPELNELERRVSAWKQQA